MLDLKRTLASAKSEMFGDWLRDPWSWPELGYITHEPASLIDRLNTGRTRFERLSVPKVNFGTRPAVVQAPTDRLAYHAVINSISQRVASGDRSEVGGACPGVRPGLAPVPGSGHERVDQKVANVSPPVVIGDPDRSGAVHVQRREELVDPQVDSVVVHEPAAVIAAGRIWRRVEIER